MTLERSETGAKGKVFWTKEEKELIADVAAEKRLSEPRESLLEILNSAVEDSLPVERYRRIAGINTVPDLVKLTEDKYFDKITTPVSVIEVPQESAPVKIDLAHFSDEELQGELSRRNAEMREAIHELLEISRSQGAPLTVPARYESIPEEQQTPRLVRKIGLLGFAPGQITELRNRTRHHSDSYKFVVEELGQKKGHLFPESTHAVLGFKSRVGQGTIDRTLGALKGLIETRLVGNIEDAKESVINICLGKSVNYKEI